MSEVIFLAGAASRKITPGLGGGPVFLAGFQQNRRATGVDQDLYIRALALRLDEQAVVLVVCDLIGLGLPDVQDIRSQLSGRGVDPNNVIVACTHTHSGPDTIGLWGPDHQTSGVDPAFLAMIKRTAAELALEALTFCCPVQIRFATTSLPGYIANARTPELVDQEVAAIQFEKPDGEIVATLLNLACHPEVLDRTSTLLSSDYAGAACRAIEEAVGGTALHVSGALGGMLTPAISERTPRGLKSMGRAYAEAALTALEQAALVSVSCLEFRRVQVQLPQQNPLFVQAQENGLLRRRPDEAGMLASECSYIDLGPVQFVGVPGELLPRLGFELKTAMPGPCRILAGLADDELGYILPDDEYIEPADYSNPGKQYEESMSLGPNTGSLIMRAAKSLIR